MARGVDGCAIFADDSDRSTFLERLQRSINDGEGEILAYCLMGNHFHAALRVGNIPIGTLLHRPLSAHARDFNRHHARVGHLFQDRFKANLILDDAYLLSTIRYIHDNPVRAGLTRKQSSWPWSSAAGRIDLDGEYDFAAYDPWPKNTTREISLLRRELEPQVEIDAIGLTVWAGTGITISELQSPTRRREVVAARRILTADAVKHGHTLRGIAKWLNCAPSSTTRYLRPK